MSLDINNKIIRGINSSKTSKNILKVCASFYHPFKRLRIRPLKKKIIPPNIIVETKICIL